jgi:hypothetical protein
MRSSI